MSLYTATFGQQVQTLYDTIRELTPYPQHAGIVGLDLDSAFAPALSWDKREPRPGQDQPNEERPSPAG